MKGIEMRLVVEHLDKRGIVREVYLIDLKKMNEYEKLGLLLKQVKMMKTQSRKRLNDSQEQKPTLNQLNFVRKAHLLRNFRWNRKKRQLEAQCQRCEMWFVSSKLTGDSLCLRCLAYELSS